MKSVITLIIVLLFTTVDSQVLGIDFGTEFWKAALISPGKNLVIVQNSRSQRKSLNSIAFHEGVRFFEEDARNKRLRKPQLTYSYLNKLLHSLDTGNILPDFQFNGETYIFEASEKEMTLEQVIAMILSNIKRHASNQADTDIRDVVLTIPANWGFKAKMSLINAAHLAQFHVLGLINENSAAAIHYAITRNDTEPYNVMFFNLGSHNLQISIMKMFGYFDESKNKTIQGVQALGHFVKEDIGGLKVDERIAHYLSEQFTKKHKLLPKENLKSFTKLLVKSSEVKQTLSANKQTHVYIEGLIDGMDLSLPIARNVIEDHEIFQEFESYLDQAIKNSNIEKSDLHAVEMIGGASRIPKVNSIVKKYFSDVQGLEVGAHINGDEAMAFGSALRAANLSLTFRVKQLYFNDPMNLDTKVIISSDNKGTILQQQLFGIDNHHGDKKQLVLNENQQDIKISVYVGQQMVKQFATKNMSDWKQKFKAHNLTNQPNLVIDFMMSSIHIAEIKDMYLNITINITEVKEKVEYVDEEVEIEVQVKEEEEKKQEESQEKQQSEGSNQQNTQSQQSQQTKQESAQEPKQSSNSQQQAQQANQQPTTEEQQTQQTNQEEQGQEQASGDKNQNTDKPKTKKKKITKTNTIKKLVEEHRIQNKRHIVSHEQTFAKYKKISKEEYDEKIKVIKEFDDYEKQLKEKAKLRNDFESALYHIKDNFEEETMKTFSTEQERQKLKEIVTTQIEWMDENAWTASKQDLQDHFKILSGGYEPIYNRTMEYRDREKSYNQTIGYFGAVYQKAEQLKTTHSWLANQAQELMKKVNSTVESLNERIKQVVSQPLHETPSLYNYEMLQMAQLLKDEYYMIRLIPRPKNEQQKAKQNVETAEEQQETEEENQEEEEEEDEDETPQTEQSQDQNEQEEEKQDL